MRENKLAVLYFTNVSERAGAEEHMLTLMRGLDRRLFEVHLACPPALLSRLESDLPEDVEVHPLTLKRPAQLGAASKLWHILRSRSIDVLHSHLFYSSLFASPIGWLARVPAVIETPHVREQWRKGWLKSRYFVDRFAGRFVDYFIAVSRANAGYLAATKGLPSRKIRVVLNGIDVHRFDPIRKPPLALRRKLRIEEKDTVLLVSGRLAPQKGHHVLLQAMPDVLRQHPRTRLVCIGTGPLAEDLERETDERGLRGVVHFAGHQPSVEDWLALADVVVLPSFYEGLPLAAIEASAAGRPVIATAVDGSPEVVVDGETGLLVPPGDSSSLAKAIGRLVAAPELGRSLGARGRRRVEEHFTDKKQIARTEELYVEAVSQRKSVTLPRTAGQAHLATATRTLGGAR